MPENSGLSLVELIVTITIIGLVTGMVALNPVQTIRKGSSTAPNECRARAIREAQAVTYLAGDALWYLCLPDGQVLEDSLVHLTGGVP
jgi:prepilin-type N-terminal cleavage/methylation domain-containing protein